MGQLTEKAREAEHALARAAATEGWPTAGRVYVGMSHLRIKVQGQLRDMGNNLEEAVAAVIESPEFIPFMKRVVKERAGVAVAAFNRESDRLRMLDRDASPATPKAWHGIPPEPPAGGDACPF